jgi:hypothetical protein
MKNSKVGRNYPCPCGSGKKFKKCCLHKIPVVKTAPEFKLITEPELEEYDELVLLMEEGDDALRNKENTKVCDIWLEVWDKLKPKFKRGVKNISDAEDVVKGFNFLFNWTQDIEIELGNAGSDNPEYYKKRIKYCDEFCTIFPESDVITIHNMKRAIAESYYAIDDVEEGYTCFSNLIEQYPDNIWSYVGWGDMYGYPMNKNAEPDFEKALEIYNMFDIKNHEDQQILQQRIEYVEQKIRSEDAK